MCMVAGDTPTVRSHSCPLMTLGPKDARMPARVWLGMAASASTPPECTTPCTAGHRGCGLAACHLVCFWCREQLAGSWKSHLEGATLPARLCHCRHVLVAGGVAASHGNGRAAALCGEGGDRARVAARAPRAAQQHDVLHGLPAQPRPNERANHAEAASHNDGSLHGMQGWVVTRLACFGCCLTAQLSHSLQCCAAGALLAALACRPPCDCCMVGVRTTILPAWRASDICRSALCTVPMPWTMFGSGWTTPDPRSEDSLSSEAFTAGSDRKSTATRE